ncbi:DUF2283 domain-containing protein [Nesterenkonia sphaerica]|uniref:DUF2283 domain-containing protein n=1 Tax=Nesterenkonia sphaerica TaxID=1804988 RepID=A0A5R9A4V2_9MICC|nr:DUF2283 domain-containing protein [Nesterenkonia sphaerica]TLP72947.1 DUF2283 domain-containing protein [Nesterenkonia sphaerica]
MHTHGSAFFDTELQVGYAYVVDKPAMRTVEFSDVILVDLAEDGDVVGLEVLARLHELPVSEMASEYAWSAGTWRAVHAAAKDLESLMKAQPTTGTDGVYRPRTTWGTRDLVEA